MRFQNKENFENKVRRKLLMWCCWLYVKSLACILRTRKTLRTRSAGCWAEKKAQKIFPDMKSWSESEGRKRRMMEDSDNNLTIYYKGGFHSHQNDIIEKQRNISINSHKTQLTKSPPSKKKSLKITSTKIPRGVCRSRAKLDQRRAAGAFEVFRSSTYQYRSQQSLQHSWQLPRQHLRFLIIFWPST